MSSPFPEDATPEKRRAMVERWLDEKREHLAWLEDEVRETRSWIEHLETLTAETQPKP